MKHAAMEMTLGGVVMCAHGERELNKVLSARSARGLRGFYMRFEAGVVLCADPVMRRGLVAGAETGDHLCR